MNQPGKFDVELVTDHVGPGVTADVSAFRGRETAPHMRAPEVFARVANAEIHSLDTTNRLGQETVDAIAPLYDFPYSSSRPDRYLTDADSERVSEVVPLLLDPSPISDHLPTLIQAAEYAAGLIGVELVEFDDDDQAFIRPLVASDIAVVIAHNAQDAGITAILRELKADGIHVGTADKMQGRTVARRRRDGPVHRLHLDRFPPALPRPSVRHGQPSPVALHVGP